MIVAAKTILGLVVGAWLAVAALIALRACEPGPAQPPGSVHIPGLDELEARMVQAEAITQRWEWLAERSREAVPIACEQMAEVAMTREVR